MSSYPKLTREKFNQLYTVINGDERPWTVKALRTSGEVPSLSAINEGGTCRIVNLNVVFPHKVQDIIDLFDQNGGEVDYEQLNGLTETYTIESNASRQDIPGKGENVKIIVGWHVPTTDASPYKGQRILVVKDMIVQNPMAPQSFGLATGVAETADEVEAEGVF